MTPKRFPDTVPIAAVRETAEQLEPGAEADDRVRVAGRVLGRRELGKLVFLDLVDRSGRIQLLCDTGRTGRVDVDLRIADELYLKRLIVGGLEKVYELAKDFRNEGVSYKHSPEFTQLEWYEAYADYRDTMERTETLVSRAAEAAIGGTRVMFRGNEIDLAPPWQRIRFVEALESKDVWSRDPEELRAKLQDAGVDTTHDKTWAQLLDHAYS